MSDIDLWFPHKLYTLLVSWRVAFLYDVIFFFHHCTYLINKCLDVSSMEKLLNTITIMFYAFFYHFKRHLISKTHHLLSHLAWNIFYIPKFEDESVSVSFIASKSKVAPLNVHGTPWLELLSTTLGLHLCQVVSKVLDDHVMKKSVFWCDSMNDLYWIKNPSRKFKSFVAYWIGEILTATKSTQRNFVNGRINPANIGSRGMDIVALSGCSTWWNKPEFLLGNKTDWSQQDFIWLS